MKNARLDHNKKNPLKHPRYLHTIESPSYLSLPSNISSWWNRQFSESLEGKKLPALNETGNTSFDNPSSEIYDACLEMNWDLAIHLCRTLPPSAVRYQEGDNLETPLYVACQNQPPLRLVQALLTIWPDATNTKSRQGDIPIHIACRYDAHISVLQALLECQPRTATHRTRFGTTPLIALWEPYCRLLRTNHSLRTNDVLMSLATTNPTLHQKYLRIQQSYTILADRALDIEEKCQLDIFDDDLQFSDKWTVTLELLKAVAMYREEYNETQFRTSSTPILHLVHAAVALKSSGCPLWVLFYVTVHNNDQYTMMDETGRLPLHIAVGPENSFGTPVSTLSTSLPQQHWKFVPKEYWSIRLSLYYHPKSALLFDPNEPPGRYPLHTAIYYGHQWHNGVQLLVDAAPHILHHIDPTVGLYPFQLAATIYVKNHSSEGLDLIFQLIRYDPTVLEFCRCRQWRVTDDETRLQASKAYTNTSNETKRRQQQRQGILLGSTVLVLAIAITAKLLRCEVSF